MAYDEDYAEIFRRALEELDRVTEKRMFGGLCFMVSGNMICGIHSEGGMARVGKEREAEAIEIDGVEPLSFTGRRMGGMVDLSEEVIEDKKRLHAVLELAKDFVCSLPPK